MANLKTCGALGLDAAESPTRLAQKEKKTPMDHSLDDLLPPSRTGHAAHPLLNMHYYTSLALPSRVAAATHLVFLMPPHYRRPPVSSPQSRRLHLSPPLPLLIRREEGDFFSQIQKREIDQVWRRPWQRPHLPQAQPPRRLEDWIDR